MEVRKNFFLRSKLGLRYDALLELLRDPDFLDVASPLGQGTWADDIVEEFRGIVP